MRCQKRSNPLPPHVSLIHFMGGPLDYRHRKCVTHATEKAPDFDALEI